MTDNELMIQLLDNIKNDDNCSTEEVRKNHTNIITSFRQSVSKERLTQFFMSKYRPCICKIALLLWDQTQKDPAYFTKDLYDNRVKEIYDLFTSLQTNES